jgi:hypothetical protein
MFKEAMPSDEGRFLTVTILQLNLVIPAGKIQGTERCHPLQRVATILNNGQGKALFFNLVIQCPVIDAPSALTISLQYQDWSRGPF